MMASSAVWLACAVVLLVVLYLGRVNQLLNSTPEPVRQLAGPPWTAADLRQTYARLAEHPVDYGGRLPPRLGRRYIVTGGHGLVGGYIVRQLLARGQPPQSIRVVDLRAPEHGDLLAGPAAEVDFVRADVASAAAVDAAFAKAWPAPVAGLPLTVFHTAAVIIPSERSRLLYAFPEAVNVRGTANVLAAARHAGAAVFSATSSASIAIRPVQPFVWPWARRPPARAWQVLDESDFFRPLRAHDDFFGNYPASKAAAERLVCDANAPGFRTGCIRPANGVYGNPADNTVGDALRKAVLPTFMAHVVQSFAHGANVAVAHLHHEAVLLGQDNAPQAGRPFVVTDPNPPIRYSDLYAAVGTLSVHPLRVVVLPPALLLLASYVIEWYMLLPHRCSSLRAVLWEVPGGARYLKPGLFSICTHLVASDADARAPASRGGLGYEGVLTTQEGMVLEVLEWNREHAGDVPGTTAGRKSYKYITSVARADEMQQLEASPGATRTVTAGRAG